MFFRFFANRIRIIAPPPVKLSLNLPAHVFTAIMVGTLGKLTALFHGNSGSKSSGRRPSVISTPPPPPVVLADKTDVQHLQRWSSLRLHRRKARQQHGKYGPCTRIYRIIFYKSVVRTKFRKRKNTKKKLK